MKFGAVPVDEAEGSVAVHSIRQGGLVLKKGTLIGKDEIAGSEPLQARSRGASRLSAGDRARCAA